MGATALKIDCLFYFHLGMIYIPRGLLNGCGDARFCLMNGITYSLLALPVIMGATRAWQRLRA